jgi:ERCC4-type nuclease
LQKDLENKLVNEGRNGRIPAQMEEIRDIIVVDTREFSCLTPIFLAEKGFWLVPMQLTIGDYVLSD